MKPWEIKRVNETKEKIKQTCMIREFQHPSNNTVKQVF